MSARNTLKAKAARRRSREIRHVGGCALCGDKEVAWVDAKTAADPSYLAICRWHLAYAVSTLFVGQNPGLTRQRHERPDERKARRNAFSVPDESRWPHGDLRAIVTGAVVKANAKVKTGD